MNWKEAAKAIAAFFGGLATWGGTAASDGQIALAEWFGLSAVISTAILVWAVPNAKARRKSRVAKKA